MIISLILIVTFLLPTDGILLYNYFNDDNINKTINHLLTGTRLSFKKENFDARAINHLLTDARQPFKRETLDPRAIAFLINGIIIYILQNINWNSPLREFVNKEVNKETIKNLVKFFQKYCPFFKEDEENKKMSRYLNALKKCEEKYSELYTSGRSLYQNDEKFFEELSKGDNDATGGDLYDRCNKILATKFQYKDYQFIDHIFDFKALVDFATPEDKTIANVIATPSYLEYFYQDFHHKNILNPSLLNEGLQNVVKLIKLIEIWKEKFQKEKNEYEQSKQKNSDAELKQYIIVLDDIFTSLDDLRVTEICDYIAEFLIEYEEHIEKAIILTHKFDCVGMFADKLDNQLKSKIHIESGIAKSLKKFTKEKTQNIIQIDDDLLKALIKNIEEKYDVIIDDADCEKININELKNNFKDQFAKKIEKQIELLILEKYIGVYELLLDKSSDESSAHSIITMDKIEDKMLFSNRYKYNFNFCFREALKANHLRDFSVIALRCRQLLENFFTFYKGAFSDFKNRKSEICIKKIRDDFSGYKNNKDSNIYKFIQRLESLKDSIKFEVLYNYLCSAIHERYRDEHKSYTDNGSPRELTDKDLQCIAIYTLAIIAQEAPAHFAAYTCDVSIKKV